MKDSREDVGRSEGWLREFLRYGASTWTQFLPLVVGLLVIVLGSILTQWFAGRSGAESQDVVLYCAQDQVFAEPLLAEFARQTGIRVRPVFDSEAVKTAGLVNRLLAERARPVCDVFWGNEELRTRQLAEAGVLVSPDGWSAFGQRSRRLVINTNHWPPPGGAAWASTVTWTGLTNGVWAGRVSMAYPLFGTTATHLLALRQHWGQSNWLTWCRALVRTRPFIEEGNSQVVRRVARGEAWIGMTDSDDIAFGQREGLPVAALPIGPESLLIPNTVALVARPGGPTEAARRLYEWLQGPAVREELERVGALEPVGASGPVLRPAWPDLVRDLDAGLESLRDVFRR